MKAIYNKPVLAQVNSLINNNIDHDPSLKHIEVTQSEWTKLCKELREKHNRNEPADTVSFVVISGINVQRVRP